MSESNRADRVLTIAREHGVDGILVCSYANRRYLSGFSAHDHGPDELAGVMLVGNGLTTLYVGPNEKEWAESEANGVAVQAWKRPWERFIAERIKELGWRRVGFEDRALIVSSLNAMAKAAEGVEWLPLGGAVDRARVEKTTSEVELLQQAIEATDRVYEAVLADVRPGMTEAQVGWMIERLTRELGGEVGFSPIVASGPHAARPHHGVTDRQLAEGEPVIVDMGVAINGYSGDLTRTFWLGEPPQRLRDVYNAVQRAHDAAMALIGPGRAGKEIDQAVRDVFASDGLGDHVVHSVGHGLGLRVHEAPSISIHSDDVLQVGHVFTVEPGVYIPGWGGVRIEDVVVVTGDGFRVMSAAPKMAGVHA